MGAEDARHGGTMSEGGPLLFAEDLATRYKMPRQRARRWLKWLEAKYGVAVVGHFPGTRGIRRYTTEAALESIGPAARTRWAEFEERMARIGAELRDINRLVHSLEQRLRSKEERAHP